MNERLSELLRRFQAEQEEQKELNRDSRVLLVDGMNMFVGAFAASPAMNLKGEHIGGVKGFLASLLACITKFRPTRCVVVFDGNDASIERRKKFSEYKAGRKGRIRLNRSDEMRGILDEGEAFRTQCLRVYDYLELMPVTFVFMDYVEADDIIGYLVNEYYEGHDNHITIVSSDKDFLQLIRPNVQVYRSTLKRVYEESTIIDEFEIPAHNFLTYRAVTGDTSDNLPGVTGIGLKSLIKLIPSIKTDVVTCDDVIRIAEEKLAEGTKLKGYKNIVDSRDKILLNEDLMQLTKVDIPANKKITVGRKMDDMIPQFDQLAFRRFVHTDGLNVGIDMLDTKAILTLSQLNQYANTR